MSTSVVQSVTCPICGSFCDDLELTIEDGRITKVKNACAMGEAKFLYAPDLKHRWLKPMIRKDEELVEASLEEAVKKAAEVLAEASYPILYGWSSTCCETIRVGIELAEEVGGVIDNTATVCHGPSLQAVQDVGLPICTLGQVRHRADVIVYWACNPWEAHPRHIERYTYFPDGRFQSSMWRRYLTRWGMLAQRKRILRALSTHPYIKAILPPLARYELSPELFVKGRKLIVIDVRRTRVAEAADYFIQVKPGEDYELLQALRALVRGIELEVDEVAGVPVKLLEEVVDVMISCDFGVIFFGLGLTMSRGKVRNVDLAIKLTEDLNDRSKWLIAPMRGHFNVTGANAVFTWQTGYPFAVDFSRGYPYYNPGETSVVDILLRGDSDAALVVASDPVAHFPKKAVEHLVKNPLVVIDPSKSATSLMADVVIPSAFVGIEAEGTAYRMDFVPLPLKKVVEPPAGLLSDEEILRMILHEVRKIKGVA